MIGLIFKSGTCEKKNKSVRFVPEVSLVIHDGQIYLFQTDLFHLGFVISAMTLILI